MARTARTELLLLDADCCTPVGAGELSQSEAERLAREAITYGLQTDSPQIRAIAYETLSTLPVPVVAPLLADSLYTDIVVAALEQKAFEYESEEARDLLEQFDAENYRRGE